MLISERSLGYKDLKLEFESRDQFLLKQTIH